MNYNKEITDPQRFTVLEAGKYRAQLIEFEDNLQTKNGDDMAKLTLAVQHDGREIKVYDWLINMESMLWKLKAFMNAVGQVYGEDVNFDLAKFREFFVMIKKEKRKDNDEFQNRVDGYLPIGDSLSSHTMSEKGSEIPDSSLPF